MFADGHLVRIYLFSDGGAIKRVPRRIGAALAFGKDAISKHAGTRQRIAQVLARNDRRACIDHFVAKHDVSERFACRVLGQHRSTQRKIPTASADEPALTADIVALALQCRLSSCHGDDASGRLGREPQAC